MEEDIGCYFEAIFGSGVKKFTRFIKCRETGSGRGETNTDELQDRKGAAYIQDRKQRHARENDFTVSAGAQIMEQTTKRTISISFVPSYKQGENPQLLF